MCVFLLTFSYAIFYFHLVYLAFLLLSLLSTTSHFVALSFSSSNTFPFYLPSFILFYASIVLPYFCLYSFHLIPFTIYLYYCCSSLYMPHFVLSPLVSFFFLYFFPSSMFSSIHWFSSFHIISVHFLSFSVLFLHF